MHSTTKFELFTLELKKFDIVVSPLVSNTSYFLIGHAFELLVNEPKIILGFSVLPIYHVVVCEGINVG